MDIFKGFFEKNENKILGKQTQKKDAWGKFQTVIEGEITNLEAIDVDDLSLSKNINSDFAETTVEQENEKIKKVIEIGKKELKNKPKTKRKKRKQKVEKTINFDAKKDIDLYSFTEGFKKLNSHLTQDQINSWVFYKMTNNFPISEKWRNVSQLPINKEQEIKFIKKNLQLNNICFCFHKQIFEPSVLYYSGNLYEKKDKLLKEQLPNNELGFLADYTKSEIVKKQLNQINHIFENDKNMKPLKIEPDESKSLRLNIHSQFLRSHNLVIDQSQVSLKEGFVDYLGTLSISEFKHYTGGASKIVLYFIEKKKFNEKSVGMSQSDFKRLVSMELTYQLNKFLNSLPIKDKEEIQYKWNKSYNGFKKPNYDLIPIGFQFNKLFKNQELKIRDAQREGVSFIEAKGNGVIAFDVGVGKTMTAILGLAQALDNDECKRPLIVVPKPTLKKWISEIHGEYEDGEVVSHGIIPQYPLINLGNLGVDYMNKFFDKDKGFTIDIPEKAICICTFSGVEHLGFTEETEKEHFEQLKEMLVTVKPDSKEKGASGKRAKQIEALNKKIGLGNENAYVMADQLGFDYLCVDEAHNFTKVFDSVRSEDGKEATSYEIYQKSSLRGVKMFFLANYIQRMNNYRNICLLTATPFNNNPLEVFGLLSLTDYRGLRESGVENIQTFFDNFIDQTFESVVKSDGKIDNRAVIKGWSNKVALQKLVFAYMNYKSGEGNVVRPQKFELPLINEKLNDGTVIPLPLEKQKRTFLDITERQKNNVREISKWLVDELASETRKGGEHLKSANWSMSNTLSPDIYEVSLKTEGLKKEDRDILVKDYIDGLDHVDFVENSPKLNYTMKCIESLINHHKKTNTNLSNVIIYSGRGVGFFPLIKEYLIDILDYKKEVQTPYGKFSEVEIISGGNGSVSDARKESCKEAFNDGYVKIIIGSQTIREGIDLQKKTSTLFNLWCEWNPTSYKQLVGRCYRFGNMYKNVRIVTPLAIGGSDAFVWQKLEEKTGRINDIFDLQNDDNILDVGVEDTSAIKWSLVDDIESLVKLIIKEEKVKIKQRIDIEQERTNEITNSIENQRKIGNFEQSINNFVRQYKFLITDKTYNSETDSYYNKYIKNYELPENKIDENNNFAIVKKIFANRNNIQKVLIDTFHHKRGYFPVETITSNGLVRELKQTLKKIENAQKFIQEQYGEQFLTNPQALKEILDDKVEQIRDELKVISSPEHFAKEFLKIEEEREKVGNQMLSFDDTVKVFTDTNYLVDDFKIEKKKITPIEKPLKKKVIVKKSYEPTLEDLNKDLDATKLSIEFEEDPKMIELLNIDLDATMLAIELH